MQLAEYRQERFLQQVGHLVAVADHAADHMRAGALVCFHQLREGRLRAVDDGAHQRLVRIQRLGRGGRRRGILSMPPPQCSQRFPQQAHAWGSSCARSMRRLSPCALRGG